MAVQINVAANQAALTASIQAGVQAYNQRFAQNNPINLSINQRAFSQPLGRMTGDVKDFEAALAASNARVIAFGASTAVLGGVIRSFKELANVTIDVEKNLADINRVFGLTTSQLQKFSTDLFSVGKQTASTFDDASKAALEFSRQGLKAEEVLVRTKDALTLTRLAGIGTANAVDALTSTVNGFAATGVTTTQILNKLVAVEQDYAVGAGDLAEALSRTGQAAQEAGVSLDQLNALVTAAQQSTARGGAVIGNALKTIFTRLQRTETLDQLEAFNIAVRDVQGNTLPAVTILQNFAGAYKNLADAQRAQLSEQVAGVYQVNILKAIVGDLNKSQGVYAGALQRGASATNEAEIATAKLNQTLDALLKQTATSTQQLANNIGKVTFEPLAKYGAEQLKSFVESMNEILEGEGVGSTFANGLLKGIRNVIAGPGAIAAFFTLFKLIQNSFTYLSQALPQIAGITTETQNRKNIEQSILQIMQQQGPASQALAGMMGNQAAQAQLLLQIARQQTAEYQMQSTLAKQLAAQLAGQGVRVKGSGGLQVTRAGGYIPAATRMAEVVGAQAGGYAPGRVVSSPVGGVMNTAEDVKYIPGFAQPFINPPVGSKAGRTHRQNSISRTGVDPYMSSGFIPNFTLPSVYEKEYGLPLLAGRVFESLLRGDDYISLTENRILADIDKGPFAAPPKEAKLSGKAAYNDKNLGIGKPKGSELALPLTAIKDYDEKLKDRGINISRVGYTHPELFAKAKEIVNREKGNKNTNISRIKLFDGFIPNFATPMSTASIPWFKKYSSKYKNAAGDTDLFKMGDFPTYGRGLDHEYAKKGNSAMLSYLHEDFVRSALNIALGSKKVIRPAEVGFKNKPVSDIANENDFDLLYRIADGSYSMLELKQDFKNVSGSVTGFMNKKLANLEKENPVLAKKVSSMIAVSNRPKFTDPTGRNAGANFSEFEMAAASIVKDKYSNVDPSISAKLTKVTDGLLRRYEAKKNTTYDGFIPNFAYKQAVMGLEESMSGNKAIFDIKPFPHIRNSSQPTFSSAIADHGGLGNALSDSMRGQKAAGLMSKGFVPNFAKQPNNGGFDIVRFSNSIAASVDNFGKQLSFKIGTVKENILLALENVNSNFDPQKIERMAESTAKKIISSVSNVGNVFTNSTKTSSGSSPKLTAAQMAASFGNLPTRNPALEKFSEQLSKASTAISIAGPMLAGFAEQAVFGNKQRSEMTSGERAGQSFLSTGLSSISTGAGIGASFGLPGAVIGGVAGSLVALTSALQATTLSVEELQSVADKYKIETQQSISAAQSYIDTLKTLQTSTDPEIIRKASSSLEQYFKNIEDVQLQKTFRETGSDVDKLATSLRDYEKRRTTEQGRKEEVAKAASYTGADFKNLTKAGYAAGEFNKRAYLQKYEKPQELAQQAITDFSVFFNDLQKAALDENGINELQKLVLQEKNRSNIFGVNAFDQDKVRAFLKSKNVSTDVSVSLSEMFDSLENEGNLVGSYIIGNLVDLFSKSKNQIKADAESKAAGETATNNFLSFRRTLLEKISDEFDSADTAIKSFESQSSLSQLLPAKLKEINDLIFNSIINNVSAAKGFSLKEGQTKAVATLQSQESLRQQSRAITEKQLKDTQVRAQFNKQISETIFNSPVKTGESSQLLIDRFIAGGPNRSKQDLKEFAKSAVGDNVNEIDKLVNSLQTAQDAFRNANRENEAQNKLKLQEIAYSDVINEITAATSLKQIDLEREKLKITLAQKGAANSLRDTVEKTKIAANERLELSRIQTGGEFRYLGLNKRQEFESRQVDLKSIFDQEQVIAENQAIADARRSIIEIAAQNANTEAQNTNTDAILNLIDAMATSFNSKGYDEILSGNEQIGLGYIQASQEMKARNEISKKQFKQSRESIQFAKLSNFGVQDNSTIGDTIAKLRTKMGENNITEEAKISIQETITTLEIASKQIGSNATIFEAKSAQMRQDFEQSAGFVNNMVIGFKSLSNQADVMVDQLGRNLPSMFADGLVDGVKAAIRESENLGDALMGIASKFLDEISTTFMRAGMYKILGSAGFGEMLAGKQKGGLIRAQSGMYISGSGTGDKYPALLENGEYVLNRNAVSAMGGPSVLDSLNFSMAPRFAAGGSYSSKFIDLKSMEANMTSEGLENSSLYRDALDAEKQNQQAQRQKKMQRKQQRAAMIGQLAAAAATIAIGAGISNVVKNAQASKAKAFTEKINKQGGILTEADYFKQKDFVSKGLMTPDTPLSAANYIGGTPQIGLRSLFSAPTQGSTWYQRAGSAISKPFGRRQTGGIIGSRLSDTIPGYMEGGLYNTPIVNRYGAGMQNGGSSMMAAGNSSSITNNNTNANNSFNFNTTVERDGTIKMGSNTTSYEQQDVELSKNLNERVYAVVSEVIRKEKQFGGSLAGVRG